MSSDDTTAMTKTTNTITLELPLDDINLILESLGALPFARVYAAISRIQEQARAQLSDAGSEQDDQR